MSNTLMNSYESAAKIMEQMLIAARQDAWEKVTELEQSYIMNIDMVKTVEQTMRLKSEKLTEAQHKRKQVLVQKILADDGEIRQLLYPVMHKITDMIFDAQLHARIPPDIV